MSLARRPLQVSSIASRCICMKCGEVPEISAKGSDPVVIEAACCGESERRTVRKDELMYTQRFFGVPEDTTPVELNTNPKGRLDADEGDDE